MEQKNIAAKLVQVMKTCGYVQKDSENKEQRYKYVSAAAVAEKVNQALAEARLASVPEFSLVSEKEKATARGGVWQLVTVQCKLTIIDADSGESVTVTSLGTGTDPGDKAVAKAQTMAMKYAWLTALNIETGDEPENDGRTDKEQFMQSGATPAPLGPGLPPGLPDTPKIRAICYLWQCLNWDLGALQEYLERRFEKQISQISDLELAVVEDEAKLYYQRTR
ncbi:MAG: hypothetical protein C4589_11150 [Peptococcaceae bacterium]|nr:MAG: hypothetical protein C4589_11150 [Peptococcaceae bacterium]